MNAATITAICTGVPAVIAAVIALVKVFQHANDSLAHPIAAAAADDKGAPKTGG